MKEDKILKLECDCHDPRCFVYFAWVHWGPCGGLPEETSFEVNFDESVLKLKDRIRKAWDVLVHGMYKHNADVVLMRDEHLLRLRDFINECIDEEKKQ